MPLAILVALILAAGWIAWKGVGHNQGTVEQQTVDPRRPNAD
ncbi:MAG TPA: hypothetical protein VGM94_06635 [Galbitalea sp.]